MTKKRSTKRALLLSALSLLLCVSLLVGSTFAWFTDSVTSKNNIIKSGNLDVELYYTYDAAVAANQNSTEWKKVTKDTDIFGYELWEPGYTKVAYFMIKNEGSLQLKYQLAADVFEEKPGVNQAGAEFLLSDYIVTDLVNVGATRDEILAKAGTPLKASYSMNNGSLAAGASKVVGMAIWMPTTVGNVANHNGKDVPEITFGINLYATQYTYEKDSFDEFYDKDAWVDGMKVYNADDLGAALAKGGKVVLEADIVANEHMDIPEGVTVALNMNGHTLTGTAKNVIYSQGNLTIAGEGKINATKQGYNYAIRAQKGSIVVDGNITVEGTFGCVEVYNGSNVTINKGSYNAAGINGMTSHTVYVAGSTLIVNGGTFDSGYSSEGIDTICGNSTATITLNGGNFYASELGESFFLKGNVVVNGGTYQYNPGSRIADGYKAIANTDGTYTVLKGDVVANDSAALNNALASGESSIALGKGEFTMPGTSGDVTISGTTDTVITVTTPTANKVALNGVTVVGSGNYTGIQHSDTVVYENCVLKGVQFLYANKVVIKNCVIDLTAAPDYIWTYSAKNVEFIDCIFNTAGKAILMYNEGSDLVTNVSVKGCTFNATANVGKAAIEIDSHYAANGHYTLVTENNTVDSNFTGEWKIKASATNNTTVNGVTYNYVEDGLYKDDANNLFIYNANGLKAFNAYMTTNAYAHKIWGATFTLLNDIDASGITWNNMQLNTPNVDCDGFTVDGNGFTISNLTINGAMFHSTANGKNSDVATVFKNLTFDNVTVNGNYHTGIIWSQMYGDIELNNVHVINSNITGMCNVGALIGRNGDEGASTVKFTNCSVKNTTVTSTGGGDNCGASAFVGMALKIPSTSATLELTFENCVAEGNTLVSAAGHQGGGIYATADVSNETWNTPVVVNAFTNFSNK